MKNNLLIVIKDFYPSLSASGNLLKKLTDSLDKFVDVTVLTRKSDNNLKEKEIIDNTEIYRINIRKTIKERYCDKKNFLYRNILLFFKIINYFYRQI